MAKQVNSIKITLTLPPRELSPNWRGHWRTKRKAVKKYRQAAHLTAFLERDGRQSSWVRATAQATFRYHVRRRRDKDNLLAMLKPAFDGVSDAGVILDDAGLTHLPVEIVTGVPKADERVEIVITKEP